MWIENQGLEVQLEIIVKSIYVSYMRVFFIKTKVIRTVILINE